MKSARSTNKKPAVLAGLFTYAILQFRTKTPVAFIPPGMAANGLIDCRAIG